MHNIKNHIFYVYIHHIVNKIVCSNNKIRYLFFILLLSMLKSLNQEDISLWPYKLSGYFMGLEVLNFSFVLKLLIFPEFFKSQILNYLYAFSFCMLSNSTISNSIHFNFLYVIHTIHFCNHISYTRFDIKCNLGLPHFPAFLFCNTFKLF